MTERRQQERPKCLTVLCWNDGELEFTNEWKANDYCEYRATVCPDCLMTYWLIKRDGQ